MYTDTDGEPDGTTPIPYVNQTAYIHVVVYGLGNSCSGQRFVPAFDLPAHVSFDTNNPIRCYTAMGQATSLSDCPQWDHVVNFAYVAGAKEYSSTDSANAGTWPLPQGAFWEFQFPVKSSTLQTDATLQGYVKMLDGNDSPLLAPTSSMYVRGPASPPAIMYDTPSTFASPLTPASTPTTYGILSEGTVVTQGLSGTVYIDRTKADGATWDGPVTLTVPGTYTSWMIWEDWDEPATLDALVANTTYKWKLGFDPDPPGGGVTYADVQTFRSLAAPTCLGQPVTVALQLGRLPTAGNDGIMGTSGADNIDGDTGNDTICSLGGNDTVIGGAGNDRIDAGTGVDTVSYAGTSAAVTVSLSTSATQNTGGAGTDTILSTENLTGGKGADRLIGNSGRNTLNGGPGSDRCNGLTGRDVGVSCEIKAGIP